MTDEKRAAMHAAIDEAINTVLCEVDGERITYVTCVVHEFGRPYATIQVRDSDGATYQYGHSHDASLRWYSGAARGFAATLADAVALPPKADEPSEVSDV